MIAKSIDFQSIFESSPDLYLILDVNFTIIAVSNHYLNATMIQREDVLGKNIFDVFPDNPEDHHATGMSNLRASLENVLNNKAPDTMAVQKYDIKRPAAEGGEFEVRYWSPKNSPVFGVNQEIQYIIHRAEDVTEFVYLNQLGNEQKKLTEELRSRAGQMEAEIVRRAQEIQETNKLLRTANKQLAEKKIEQDQLYQDVERKNILLMEANSELEAFSYSAAHDLKNPLQVIAGFSLILQKSQNLNDKEQDYLERIIRASQKMNSLIEDLLSFSLAIRSPIVPETVDMSTMALFILNSFQDQNPERTLEFSIENHMEVAADPQFLKIALENLLGNAWKYTSKNAITKIEFGTIKKKNKPIIYFIRDNGIGFSQKKASTLFVPFVRLHSEQEFAGTGIGLSIIKRIIERHGGSIWTESEEGKGSTFFFTLSK